MPSKYPVLPPSAILSILEKEGFSFVSQRGNHVKYSNGTNVVIIPMHKEVAKGTLKSILEQAGLTLEQFKTKL